MLNWNLWSESFEKLNYVNDWSLRNSIFAFTDHPEVFTVDAMMPYLNQIPSGSAITKNLFLKDKKGGLYLLSALHDKPVNMNDISKRIKAPGLRFASEDILFETLGVKQGCVLCFDCIHV